MKKQLQKARAMLKREAAFVRAVWKHPQTPPAARWLLGAAIAYAAMPFDLIPDFLPVIGHLDDAVIVPSLIYLAFKKVPREIIDDCRASKSE